MYQIKELSKLRKEIETLQYESGEIWQRCLPRMIMSIIIGGATFFWYYQAVVTKEINLEVEDFLPLIFLIFLSCALVYFFLSDLLEFISKRLHIHLKRQYEENLLEICTERISEEYEKEFSNKKFLE
jgi:hypothetical protein